MKILSSRFKVETVRLDLGIRELLRQWKELLTFQFLREDFSAGATVACVAVPLSLAIALASNVPPSLGLLAAIIGGSVAALFGGTPLAISGPAAAMAILIGSLVKRYGLDALLMIGLGAGVLQLLSGIFGLGKLIRFIPLPVIAGFTAGIGTIIFVGQLPRALGLPPSLDIDVADNIFHLVYYFGQAQILPSILSLGTLSIALILPRFFPKLPAPLLAVIVMTSVHSIFSRNGADVEVIGSIPRSLPTANVPQWPTYWNFHFLQSIFVFYFLASLETLLSSSAVDKLAMKSKHDPNQELIGQGLANLICSLFGSIPVTGVIARSALNVHAGARTRRAALIQVLFLICTVILFAPLIEQIPIAVLSGILLSVSLKMLNPREMIHLWKVSRIEVLSFIVTFLAIISTNLLTGIEMGMLVSFFIITIQLGHMKTNFFQSQFSNSYRFSFSGPLTFLSSGKLDSIRLGVENIRPDRSVIINMSRVTLIDASAAAQLIEIVNLTRAQGARIALQGLKYREQEILIASDPAGLVGQTFSLTESDTFTTQPDGGGTVPLERLISGVDHFIKNSRSHYQQLFNRLADTQSPHTLFITCSDSRINPNLITSTDPGELFIVRNVGNMVPSYEIEMGHEATPTEGAAIEFALHILRVTEIVVCGHSGCAAMKAICSQQNFSQLPSLNRWLHATNQVYSRLPRDSDPDQAARLNTLTQLDHLKTYPLIAEKLKAKQIRLHAWYYNIKEGEIEEWNQARQQFQPVTAR